MGTRQGSIGLVPAGAAGDMNASAIGSLVVLARYAIPVTSVKAYCVGPVVNGIIEPAVELMGERLVVGQQTLDMPAEVRILLPQPGESEGLIV